jgi:integrase
LVAPTTENRTVTPQRAPNAELRTREHLTADEVETLMEAAKANRHGYRDALMVLLAYRHGLRAAEVVDLREQVDFNCTASCGRSLAGAAGIAARSRTNRQPIFGCDVLDAIFGNARTRHQLVAE